MPLDVGVVVGRRVCWWLVNVGDWGGLVVDGGGVRRPLD